MEVGLRNYKNILPQNCQSTIQKASRASYKVMVIHIINVSFSPSNIYISTSEDSFNRWVYSICFFLTTLQPNKHGPLHLQAMA